MFYNKTHVIYTIIIVELDMHVHAHVFYCTCIHGCTCTCTLPMIHVVLTILIDRSKVIIYLNVSLPIDVTKDLFKAPETALKHAEQCLSNFACFTLQLFLNVAQNDPC